MTPILPYPGLRPFQMQEAELFFGRGEQINQMLSRLETRRFLAVVGTSGCGKSSLVAAGLLPALQDGFLSGAEGPWHFIVFRPGNAPFTRLAEALYRCSSGQGAISPQDVALTAATLAASPRGLKDAIHDLGIPSDVHLLLVVDQFEEIFRCWRETDRNKAEAFVALLLATVRQNLPIHVVLTMRSDYLGDCAIFNALPEMLNDSQYLTPRLTREQRRAAIESPARVCGGSVEPALVNQLLNDMGAQPDQLPIMQHALMRLWLRAVASGSPNQAKPIVLRYKDYQEIGGLAQALDRHAEEIFRGLSVPHRIAEILFRCLSERDTDSMQVGRRDTRRPASLDSIAKVAGVSVEQVAAVADVFRAPEVNFLTPPAEVPLTPQTLLDVTHESLLQRWQRLQGWVVEEAKSAEIYRRLVEAAKQWSGKDSGSLMGRRQLSFILDWLKRDLPTAAWAERYGGNFDLAMRFFEESSRAEKERIDESTRAEKERLVAQETEKKRNLILKLLSWGLGLAVVMLALVIYCAITAHNAENAAHNAENEAQKQKAIADKQRLLAENQAQQAKREAQIAIVLRLTTQVESAQLKTPLTSTLLSVEAMNLASQPNVPVEVISTVQDSYRKALANIGGQGYWAGQGPITKLAVNTDQSTPRWLAAAGKDGSLALWDMRPAQGLPQPTPLSFGFSLPIHSLMISRDAHWLVSRSGPKNLLTLWDIKSPNLDCKVTQGYSSLYLSTAGEWLLSYGIVREGNTPLTKAKLFDLRLTNPVASPINVAFPAGDFRIAGMSFSSNKKWLAVVNLAGDAFLCDLQTAKPAAVLQARQLKAVARPAPKANRAQNAINCEFTDSSDKLVVFFADGTVRLWEDRGGHWDQAPKEDKLNTSFKEESAVNVVTDYRGLRAVAFKKTAELPAKSVAYFFDASHSDFPKSTARLAGFDGTTIDTTKHFLMDERKQWLVAHGKSGTDGILVWNLKDANILKLPISLKPPEGVDQTLLTSDGRWLVTRGRENTVRLYDLSSPGFSSNSLLLRGHDGPVSAVAMDQPNHWLVTGGNDGSLRTWDLAFLSPSAEPATFHNPLLQSMLVTPNRRWLAFAAGDGDVRLWDLGKGDFTVRPRYRLACFPKQVSLLQSSKDSRWLATTSRDATGKQTVTILWDLEAQPAPKKYCELGPIQGRINDFAVSADGSWIAANVFQDSSTSVQLWKTVAATGPKPQPRSAERQDLPRKEKLLLGFVASGKVLLTLSDGKYSFWGLGAESIKAVPSQLEGRTYSKFAKSLLTADGKYLITPPEGGKGGNYLVFDVPPIVAGKSVKPKILEDLTTLNNNFSTSANNRWLIGPNKQSRVVFWDLGSEQATIPAIPKHNGSKTSPTMPVPYALMVSGDKRWLVVRLESGQCHLYDLRSTTSVPDKHEIQTNVSAAIFSPDSLWLITSGEGIIQVRSLQTPGAEVKATLEDKDWRGIIQKAAVSPDGRWVAVVDQALLTRIWDLAKGKNAKPMVLPTGVGMFPTPDLFVSADGSLVMAVDQSIRSVRISRVQIGELLKVAERTVGRNLSRAEWIQFKLPADYQRLFDTLPEPPTAGTVVLPVINYPGEGSAKKLGKVILHREGELTAADPKDRIRNYPCKIYELKLRSGALYFINMQKAVKGSSFDSYLRLEGPLGTQVAIDDDSGGDLNARIVYNCQQDGVYNIIATTFNGLNGKFVLTVREAGPPPIFAQLPLQGRLDHFKGQLTAADWENAPRFFNCPCKVYDVQLQAGKVYQLDLADTTFAPYLSLEDAGGTLLDESRGQNPRIVFLCGKSGTYRVNVTSSDGKPGGFTLVVQSQ